ILGCAEHHLRTIAIRQPAQHAQELVAVHFRHVPVEQHGVRHLTAADIEGLLAVLGFHDLEVEAFENSASDFADHARIINHQPTLTVNPLAAGAPRCTSSFGPPPALRGRPAWRSSPTTAQAPCAAPATSTTRSTSTPPMSLPSSRCTPADTR